MEKQDQILLFVKATAEANRLRVIGLLARGPRRLDEIASALASTPAEAARHLGRLSAAGLLREVDGRFMLDEKAVESMARAQFDGPRPGYIPAADLDEPTRRILKAFLTPEGTLKQIPLQPAKLKIILDYLAEAFIPGADYTEKRVNSILQRFHPDSASLRRFLIDAGLLARESDGSRYWRPG